MTGTLPAEALCLSTGLFAKHAPTPADTVRASKLHAKVEAALKRFLRGDKPEKWEAWQRPPGQEDLHQDLVTPTTGEGWQVEHIPDPIIYPQWILVVNGAKKYLADKWPIFNAEGLTPANYALADDEYGDVWELVRAVDGLDNFLADFESYVLTREQVEAFQACYPDFYESIDGIVFEQLVALVRSKKELGWEREDMIRILRSLPDEDPIIVQQTAPQSKPPTGAQQSKRINETRPTAERIEANEAR
jgi:hypothetical protein